MEILRENFWWMIPNLALASLGFVFALLYLRVKNIYLKVPILILWFLFLPNTIYLITDIEHLIPQLKIARDFEAFLLILQYTFLISFGVLTYFAGMIPIEMFFRKKKVKSYSYIFLVFNFALAFAVVLGKIERTHSWYVFTQPLRVLGDMLHVFMTPHLILGVIFFGILFNLIYFAFRRRFAKLK